MKRLLLPRAPIALCSCMLYSQQPREKTKLCSFAQTVWLGARLSKNARLAGDR